MNIIPETKACESCARAKRKCGKELPGCHRCTSRGFACVYPPARPTPFVRLQQDHQNRPQTQTQQQQYPTPPRDNSHDIFEFGSKPTDIWDPNLLFTPVSDFDLPLSDCPISTDMNVLLGNLQPPARIPTPPRKHLDFEWFLSPDTWKRTESLLCQAQNIHEKSNGNINPAYPISNLKNFLKKIQHRSIDWVKKGTNDYIHKELYTFRNPRCIQDAQSAFALYLTKTDETEDAVFRTLHARAKQLLQDEKKHDTWSSHSVFNHLARCQALITYQVIGLMDGDIQLRGAAEERIETLKSWMKQCLESAVSASNLCFTGSSLDNPSGKRTPSALDIANAFGLGVKDILVAGDNDSTDLHPFQSSAQQEAVWHAWIFAESLRRTWIMTSGLQATYMAIKTGWAECMQSMKLTAGQGMWDARSSYAWEKRCIQGDVFFMEGLDMYMLLGKVRPEEVDGFTKTCMEATWGADTIERWCDSAVV